MPRHRVGVEGQESGERVGDERPAKAKDGLERVQARHQKDLLRKKKAQRRAHAQQRLVEKARREEERKQADEVALMRRHDFTIRGVEYEALMLQTGEDMELWPKHGPSLCPSRTEAAARTIQKAVKKQLKKCQRIFRHSSRIFVEESVGMLNGGDTSMAFVLPDRLPVVPGLKLPQLKASDSPRSLALSSCSSCSCSDEDSSCSCSCSSSSCDTNERHLSARRRRSLHETPTIASLENPTDKKYGLEQDAMVIKIQARLRGYHGRKQAYRQSLELDKKLKDEALKEIQDEAIVKIQARARGVLVRNKLCLSAHETRQRCKRRQEESVHLSVKSLSSNLEVDPGSYEKLANPGTWPQEWDCDVAHPLELEKVSDRLRVFCGTWNMHAKKPRDDLRLWIRWQQYHIVAVGSEECVHSIAKSVVFTSKKAWEDQLKAALGPEYVLVTSHALTAIHNVVFVHTSLVPLLGNIQSDAVATGLGNQLGNKGGVGIAFTLGGTSFAFVNCHFEAHQRNVARRNGNFHRINTELKLLPGPPVSLPPEPSSPLSLQTSGLQGLGRTSVNRFSVGGSTGLRAVSEVFDRVFWYGDLNYRINGTRRMVDTLLVRNHYDVLVANDQLHREMKAGNVFAHFQEGPLHFRPTYKFDKRSDVYDSSSKQRIPSWTDRVLYVSNPANEHGIELLSYRSQPNFRTSDHRPVCATFQVTFRATEASLPRGLPHENRATSQVCNLQ